MTPLPASVLLRPSQAQWRAVPRMLSHKLLRGAILLGFGGFMGTYFWLSIRGEPEPPTVPLELSLTLAYFLPHAAFAAFILILGPVFVGPRPGIWVALLAVQVQGMVSVGFGLEPVWWYWYATVILGTVAVADLVMGVRQFVVLDRLRAGLVRDSPPVVAGSREHPEWIRNNALRGRWGILVLGVLGVIALILFVWLVDRARREAVGPDAVPFDSFLLTLSIGAGLGVAVLLCRMSWRLWRARRFGSIVWILPDPGTGPVSITGTQWQARGELSTDELARKDCICAGHEEVSPENPSLREASDEDREYGEIDRHCALHGVDVVNALGAAEFARCALTRSWVWDSYSSLPVTALGLPAGILGYAGSGLLGRVVLLNGIELMDGGQWASEPEENHAFVSLREALRKARNKSTGALHPAPSAGRLDTLDLRPFGIAGFAQRYKHEYPIFVADHSGPDGEKPPTTSPAVASDTKYHRRLDR